MIKIAVLIDLEWSKNSGGHVKFWERICESLEKKKLDIDLELFFLGKKKKRIKLNQNLTYNIQKPVISSGILRFLGVDADYTDLSPFNLSLFLKLRKFNLIHSTDQLYCMSNTAKIASKFWKIPLTTSYHTDAPSYSKFYIKKIFNLFPHFISNFFVQRIRIPHIFEKRLKKRISRYFSFCKIAFINDHMLSRDIDIRKIGNCRIEKLQRGVNKKIFRRIRINKEHLLKRFSIPYFEKIIFFCGRIHELKGAVFLSKINFELQKKNKNLCTIMAGHDLEGYKCRDLGGKNIFILGDLSQQDVSLFYNACDLFVFPSRYETGPQVIIEAKSCNAVCVVSPEGGGRRIEKNGFDGIIIKGFNIDHWTEIISRLLNKKGEINLIKKNLMENLNYNSWFDVYRNIFMKYWKNIIKNK